MSDKLVVDASLAAKWLLEEDFSQEARCLFQHWATQGTRLFAPALLVFEITNVVRRRVTAKEISLERARLLLRKLFECGINLEASMENCEMALVMAEHHMRPSSYDAHYLALANTLQCEFWTADKRLYNAVAKELSCIRCIGENEF